LDVKRPAEASLPPRERPLLCSPCCWCCDDTVWLSHGVGVVALRWLAAVEESFWTDRTMLLSFSADVR
jgi:hypothetical protein